MLKSDTQEDDRGNPFFETFDEPGQDQVGHIISLTCGHTQRPSEIESLLITQHLTEAGFVGNKGSHGSPDRETNISAL